MIYLTAEELLVVARRVVGDLVVRDIGLVESAAARPRTQIGGTDAYPDLLAKAAALLHSLTRNHALLDGNKRLALAGTIVFLGVNGTRLVATNDDAYDLIMDVAAGRVDDVESIRERLAHLTEAW
ncbi:type II toxin-antitoxin system death-on-curing family toxin [Cellulomonas sp. zg-ZUI222]|uniref:Type II toxin-antitoxin system death-on-curing family toxin n=2 Tax=Cellulomonas TaxID=1707 RepID=A0ABY5JZJ8_9CELL|nr:MULTISPECIES: type II toxin-antitoxin system death-on-curing family toxin [Cellulomonas]MBO0900158.1 type II toxin-antitoxin system death-on-curing family toxin [Cellulomonas sp. zg-ZUI22]MBO0920927.1 type II toxin-antitoxin system death-on-curing family toxin [Cellulomonas wangleii]MBO0925592.1 type II toxin-antitoxin system death-on-curing family toxin [Cellulomonas wangleii]MCC2333425.1 type II toxin-antitoxin system death-on-curing family toxin [Cellulomonas wangsupingiae]MCM0638279.1 t